MNVIGPEQALVDILSNELGMPAGSVWIDNQNRMIPNDTGLYIAVGQIGAPQVIGNVTETVSTDAGMSEIQQLVVRENVQIDIFSTNNAALIRRWEIIMALQSTYAQQVQELNNFKIFAIPSGFANTSSAEGGSNINRFTATISCHTWYRKEKVLTTIYGDYYDHFCTDVIDETSTGDFDPNDFMNPDFDTENALFGFCIPTADFDPNDFDSNDFST